MLFYMENYEPIIINGNHKDGTYKVYNKKSTLVDIPQFNISKFYPTLDSSLGFHECFIKYANMFKHLRKAKPFLSSIGTNNEIEIALFFTHPFMWLTFELFRPHFIDNRQSDAKFQFYMNALLKDYKKCQYFSPIIQQGLCGNTYMEYYISDLCSENCLVIDKVRNYQYEFNEDKIVFIPTPKFTFKQEEKFDMMYIHRKFKETLIGCNILILHNGNISKTIDNVLSMGATNVVSISIDNFITGKALDKIHSYDFIFMSMSKPDVICMLDMFVNLDFNALFKIIILMKEEVKAIVDKFCIIGSLHPNFTLSQFIKLVKTRNALETYYVPQKCCTRNISVRHVYDVFNCTKKYDIILFQLQSYDFSEMNTQLYKYQVAVITLLKHMLVILKKLKKGGNTLIKTKAIVTEPQFNAVYLLSQLFETLTVKKNQYTSILDATIYIECRDFKPSSKLEKAIHQLLNKINIPIKSTLRSDDPMYKYSKNTTHSVTNFIHSNKCKGASILRKYIRDAQSYFVMKCERYVKQLRSFVKYYQHCKFNKKDDELNETFTANQNVQIQLALNICFNEVHLINPTYVKEKYVIPLTYYFNFHKRAYKNLSMRLFNKPNQWMPIECINELSNITDDKAFHQNLEKKYGSCKFVQIEPISSSLKTTIKSLTIITNNPLYKHSIKDCIVTSINDYLSGQHTDELVLICDIFEKDLKYRNTVYNPINHTFDIFQKVLPYQSNSVKCIVFRIKKDVKLDKFIKLCKRKLFMAPYVDTYILSQYTVWYVKIQ